MRHVSWRPWLLLLGFAVLLHGIALVGTARRLGGIDAYAFRSTDSVEYWDLARSLAADGLYSRQGRPDLWRVPVYPMFLAGVERLFGESPRAAVLCQHGLAILNLMLFGAGASMLLRPRSAAIAAGLWAIDPFRIYYSGWLLAEALFITWLLLAGIIWLRIRGSRPRLRTEAPLGPGGILYAAFLGLIAGVAMLTRPIGVFLPVAAIAGLLARRGGSWRRRCGHAAACALCTAVVVMPWLVRNRAASGRWALSCQSGVSLAYFKVVEVLLWERGLTASRFDRNVVNPILEEMDTRLADLWRREYGSLSRKQADELRWSNIIYGKLRDLPPVEVSRELWRIGAGMLAERPGATAACFAARAASLLAFPAPLGLWPPSNAGAAPFATVLGAGRPGLARAAAVIVGGAFAMLAAAAGIRVFVAIGRRERFAAWFAFVALVGFLAMVVPFEDPRFREPLVPMMLALALAPRAAGFRSMRAGHVGGPMAGA